MLNSIIRKYLDNKFHPNWTIHEGCTDINSLSAPIFTKFKSLKKLLCTRHIKNFYHRVKKNQLDAQLILSILRQPLHVSGVSRPIIRRYNRMYTTTGTYYSWSDWNNPTRTTYGHLKRIISTNCCILTVVPTDDGPRYARNM